MTSRAARRARIYLVIRLLHGRAGGAERLFCETANLFAEQGGHDVTCLYCDSSEGEPFYPISSQVRLVNLRRRGNRRALGYRALDAIGKRYPARRELAVAHWLSRNLFFVRRLAEAFRAGAPDVVISYLPPANTPSLIAGALARVPVIPTNHNVPEKDYDDSARWDQNPIDRRLRLAMLRRAARVHVLFPGFADWFPEGIREKVVAIPNFVSPELDGLELPERREPIVVAAGRLAAVKGYGLLVDAWARVADELPGWRVRIYGEGEERRGLEARIRELGLERSVELMGRTSHMKGAYLGGAVFAHPARHEGFGLAVAEALRSGLPVVAFADCPGVNELVAHEHNGLLVERAGGVEAYAAALKRLATDDALRARLAANAPGSMRPYAKERYLERWNEVIRDVRAQTARRP